MAVVATHTSRIKASPAAVVLRTSHGDGAGPAATSSPCRRESRTSTRRTTSRLRPYAPSVKARRSTCRSPASRSCGRRSCRKLERENGSRYTPEQVLVCNGGKQVIYNALTATRDPGQEVVILAP